MTAHPANALFHALRKMAEPSRATFGGPVSDEQMARTRALFPELMADLRRRRDAPRSCIAIVHRDHGEQDYDFDLGREYEDYLRDNGGR